MNKEEQIQYVKGFLNQINKHVIEWIKSGKTEGFDGFELNLAILYHIKELTSGGIYRATRERFFKNAWRTRGF
jgi:hypothetical protein